MELRTRSRSDRVLDHAAIHSRDLRLGKDSLQLFFDLLGADSHRVQICSLAALADGGRRLGHPTIVAFQKRRTLVIRECDVTVEAAPRVAAVTAEEKMRETETIKIKKGLLFFLQSALDTTDEIA